MTNFEETFEPNDNQRIVLNVGGLKHEATIQTLKKLPNSRLGGVIKATREEEFLFFCDDFNLDGQEFYFDRDPTLFNCILNYYRTGELHISDDLCPVALKHELIYWNIPNPKMDICCEEKLYEKQKKLDEAILDYKIIEKDVEMIIKEEIEVNLTKFSRFKNRIWNMVDNSFDKNSTQSAKIFGAISTIFIAISTVNLIFGTDPDINRFDSTIDIGKSVNITFESPDRQKNTEYLDIIEIICIAWFTFEYLIRLANCPNLTKFMRNFLNLVDILCILPFYFGLFLSEYQFFIKVKYLLQMLRVLRLLKLGRYSNGIKSFAFALKTSSKALGFLLVLLMFNVLLFSSFIYFAEQENPKTKYTSILASCWWGIITTTTVGYGDMTPSTLLGKIIASFCAIIGIIMLALPLGVISGNFNAFEKYSIRFQKMMKSMQEKALKETHSHSR